MSGLAQHLQILLVMADRKLVEAFSRTLTSAGHTVCSVSSSKEARSALRREGFDVMVTDTALESESDGVFLAEEVLSRPTRPQVIALAAKPDVRHAVALTRAGTLDYRVYPIEAEELRAIIEAAPIVAIQDDEGFDEFLRAFMVSSVPEVQEMSARCRIVAAKGDATALIVGESGSGKGVVCRTIHWLSAQSRAPLVGINLVDIAPDEVERKLFGTGTGEDGLLATARSGTLLIREFSEIQPELQSKILLLLETRTYRPVDGNGSKRFDGRLLATSTNEVDELVSDAMVDPKLAYRLATVTIRVPPLRQRMQDLPRIANAMLAQVASDASRPNLSLTVGARQVILDHPWAGNLRELRNVLTRLALLCPRDEIDADELARALGFPSAESRRTHRSGVRARVRNGRRSRNSSVPMPKLSGLITSALDDTARAERERIETALEASDGHRERAAAVLGMSRTTLWTRMRLLGIDYGRFHPKAKAQ